MITIGSVLDGKYKILYQIGEGGMSSVYLAINEKVNRQWAVKEIRKDRPYNFALMRQGILREMELLRSLHHPMIPEICDVIEEETAIFIVMDYIEGRTLGNVVEEEGAQEEKYVIEWAKQLCQVLSYLHNRVPPVIYRDMKPSNIMLKPNGDLMLIDFGISREFCEEHTEDTVCLGTQGYAAPEQFGGGQSDERTDIYGLGATLHHLVTGENPRKRQGTEFLPVCQLRPEISGGLEEVIRKCLERNPDDRYQSCRELWYALEHYQELDRKRMKHQKRKLWLCVGLFSHAFLSFGISCFAHMRVNMLQVQNYQFCLQMASNQEGNEKMEVLRKAIEMDPKREEAYLLLLEEFLKDENFSSREDLAFREILNETGDQKETYEMSLQRNQKGYEKVSYEAGIAYFFFYEKEGSKERSLKWFMTAENAEWLSQDQKVRAAVCKRIGSYWKDMGKRDKTGDFQVSHAVYFYDLWELYQMQKACRENEIMTLKVCQEMIAQILSYADEIEKEGVKIEEMKNVLEASGKEIQAAQKILGEQHREMIQAMEEEITKAEQKIDLK
ncbi:MAG: serine/threonine-protein kinase [Lachnospiraceae bacterium]|nr:serine/threonine protein kinase [Robinsoniella sp.]MDY3767298.1 serine/threonine-protein kinase [Lachnospiraceae bacterium]